MLLSSQNLLRKSSCFPWSLSPGNGGTMLIIVETLHKIEEASDGGVKKVNSDRSWEYTDGHPLMEALWCCVKVCSHSNMSLLSSLGPETLQSHSKKMVCLNSDFIEMNGKATGWTVKYLWNLKFYHSFCVVWWCTEWRVMSSVLSQQSDSALITESEHRDTEEPGDRNPNPG